MDRRSIIILRKGLRNDPIVRAPRVLSLASRREFLKAASAGAICGVLSRAAKAGVGAVGRAQGSVGTGLAGFYPVGHWVNSPIASLSSSNQTATQILPRPDAEMSAAAFYKWFYYSPGNAFQNVKPVCGRCGAFPYVYQIIQAPAAANAVMGATYWQPNWTIAQALAASYGDLLSSPTGTFSDAAFQVRLWDQTGNYNDFEWAGSTIAGYDATNGEGFVFLDPSAGADPGSYPSSGISDTYNSPIKTMLWAFGASNTDVTYPNAILAIKPTASVPVFAQNAQFGIEPVVGKSPISVISASTQVTIDMTNAGTSGSGRSCAFNIQANSDDTVFQNLEMSGGPSSAVNFSPFLLWTAADRILLYKIAQPNAWSGTAPTDNPSLFTILEAAINNYIWMKGCSDSNRTDSAGGSGTEAFALFVWGDVQYGGAELCTSTGCESYGPWWKWSDGDVTLRTSQIIMAGTYKYPTAAADYIGSTPRPLMQNREVCYCIMDGSPMAFEWNQSAQANGSNVLTSATYRNSFKGYINVWAAAGNTGPYISTSDAIQYGTGKQAFMLNNATGSLASNMQLNTPDAQAAAGVFTNPSGGDYSLAAAYAAWNGLRGAFIS